MITSGTLFLIPTYLTGQRAAGEATSPFPQMLEVLAEHADWATYTLRFFCVYAILRLALVVLDQLTAGKSAGSQLQIAALLIGVAGIYLLYETGQRGGPRLRNGSRRPTCN